MSANVDNVLVQANFKTPRGALLNVYGKDEESFDLGLAILEDRVAKLTEIEALLAGSSNAVPLVNTAAAPAPATAAQSWGSTPPASMTQGTVPTGPDGQPRVPKSGTSAKGPWKAWMTAAKKNEPGYAEPIWVRRGTPEWDAFPA
jgi:hypothetical protein